MIILFIELKCLFEKITEKTRALNFAIKRRIIQFLVPRLSLKRGLVVFSYLYYYLGRHHHKRPAKMAAQNYQLIVGKKNKHVYARVWRMKYILDMAIYLQNPDVIKNMHELRDELNLYLNKIRTQGKTPLLAPLHMSSDMAASVLCSMVEPKIASVISIYKLADFGPEERKSMDILGIDLQQINPLESSRKLAHAIKQCRHNTLNLVVFPDALPQSTYKIVGKMMPTKPVKLFNRQGKLHLGLDRIAHLMKAEVLFFYIYMQEGKLRLRLFPVVPQEEIEQHSTAIIETALREHPESWLLWHYPSLFYFNSSQ